jgi:hypothetical protein
MKNFTVAGRRAASSVNNPVAVEFQIEKGAVRVANPPSTGQLIMFFRDMSEGGTDAVDGIFGLLRVALSESDYNGVQQDLRDGKYDIEMLIEVVQWLVEQWSGRPTQPSSESSPSRKRTGRPSTAKPRSVGRTSPRSL